MLTWKGLDLIGSLDTECFMDALKRRKTMINMVPLNKIDDNLRKIMMIPGKRETN